MVAVLEDGCFMVMETSRAPTRRPSVAPPAKELEAPGSVENDHHMFDKSWRRRSSSTPPAQLHKVHLPSESIPADQLLETACSNLRCIDGDQLTFELMSSNTGGSLEDSRPVGRDETIDFFMSHSWHDDPHSKFQKLKQLCDTFCEKHGRQPTFWLDKVLLNACALHDAIEVVCPGVH